MASTPRCDIGLELSGEHWSLIVEGLAEQPFKHVFELIGQLHAGVRADAATSRCTVNPAQLRLILDALGGMPFRRVNGLLQSMHRQIGRDLAAR